MQPGELVQERYALEEPIGRGGMAQVWRARDQRLDRPVAIKFLAPGFAEQPEFLVRLFNEAQSVAAISHPHVTHVLDYGFTDTGPYLVMEYLSGGNLCDLMGQPLSSERAIEIMVQVAAGAGAAHDRGIVHRDIKPGNILLSEDGVAKLADFGIASTEAATHLTATGEAIGSARYISPEQAMGEHATAAADVYSMGVVLYELLTGCLPFQGGNATAIAIAHVEGEVAPPSTLIDNLDPRLDAAVMRCLAKQPQERFANGNELAEVLEGIAATPRQGPSEAGVCAGDGDTQLAAAAVPMGPTVRVAGPRSVVLKKIAVALVAAALLAVIAIHLTSQPSVAGPRPKAPRPVGSHRAVPSPSRSGTTTTTSVVPAATPTQVPTPTTTSSRPAVKISPRKTPHPPTASPSPKVRPTPAASTTAGASPSPSLTPGPSSSPSPTAAATPTS